MAKKKRYKGFMAYLHDLAYSFPIFRGIVSIFLEFYGKIFNPKLPNSNEIAPPPTPVSRFDVAMTFLESIILNGAFITVPIVLLFPIPFRLEYVFGFGLAHFMARDVLENFFWRPLTKVAATRRNIIQRKMR